MQTNNLKKYKVRLESPVSDSFRCVRAANSLDINMNEKSVHELEVDADLDSPFNIGLILGASGSGKTTLAKQIYGEDALTTIIDTSKPIIEQFPKEWSYDDCANALAGMGLTSVPCWIRPVYTLSNGQKARAEAALGLSKTDNSIHIIDEWTSVVDRTVAKVMSHCVQKHARKSNKKIILLSCHYDVIEWLNPDWIIDCNKQEFIDRRALSLDDRKRSEQLQFAVKEVDKSTWKYFSKYHYLSKKLPAGRLKFYGLFEGENQIGFQCFANYTPHSDKTKKMIMHSNRTVIHPDYAGLGLGILLINETSKIMSKEYKVMAKFSSTPIFKAMSKYNNEWKLIKNEITQGRVTSGGGMDRKSGFRENVRIYVFEYIGAK